MARGATWTNSDGLVVGFGTHSSDNTVSAVTEDSAVKTLVVQITGTELVDTFAATNIKPQDATIKRGSVIRAATLLVTEAFTSGGAATLDIGTWSKGKATEVVDVAAGILSGAAITTIDAIGEVSRCGGTLVASTISCGATSDSDVVIAPSWGTAAFTAGKATLTIEYIEPRFIDPVLA